MCVLVPPFEVGGDKCCGQAVCGVHGRSWDAAVCVGWSWSGWWDWLSCLCVAFGVDALDTVCVIEPSAALGEGVQSVCARCERLVAGSAFACSV